MLLAIDDTDGPEGGCTTHTVFAALEALPHLVLRGMPRLVRCNPSVPWKTRGNAAICLDLGLAEGPRTQVGQWQGRAVEAYPDAPAARATQAEVDAVWAALQPNLQDGANPAISVFDAPPSALAYGAAVQTFVPPEIARGWAEADAVAWHAEGDGRGLAGCLAAAAWPGPASSYELIGYRAADRWGTPRAVGEADWAALDASGATFHGWDAQEQGRACVPNTPCPVLWGLRGQDPERLVAEALPVARKATREPVDGWLLFASNQASGDHVVSVDSLSGAPAMSTVQVAATVLSGPEDRQGGHVFVTLQDAEDTRFDAAAFEPTKGFRQHVRDLHAGDEVTVVGAFADGVVRLEKLQLRVAAPGQGDGNPLCACGDRMKSKGKAGPLRCPTCGTEAPRPTTDRRHLEGWYEVPVVARRHLHRPLAWSQPREP